MPINVLNNKNVTLKDRRGCPISLDCAVIELVEMTISTKYAGFDKLNHRVSFLLDNPFSFILHMQLELL